MTYKHIIWDWNGTLLDDVWLCIESINIVLSSRGMPKVNANDYRNLFCFPVIDYYKKLGFNFKNEKFPIPEFLENYNGKFHECELHNDTKFVLKNIMANGLTQSILSAGNQASLIKWVKHHKIDHMFSDIIGVDNDRADSKIDSGINWLQSKTLTKKDILLIGDTIHDLEVASVLDVDCILVDIGHVSSKRLIETGVPILSSLASVFNFIDKRC